MRGRGWSLLVLLCACKAEIGGTPITSDADGIDGAPLDAPPDAVGTFGPWATPLKVPGASSATANEDDGTLSNSKLELVFALSDPDIDAGRKHLYYMSRPSVSSMTWSAPVRLAFNADGSNDETPRFSADDKTLYFASNRSGTNGGLDIWMVTRATVGQATGWSTPTLAPTINSTATDKWCMPCSTGSYLMISSRSPSTSEDVYEGSAGAAPTRSATLSSTAGETGTFITEDCRTAYFASTRSGTNRIYKTTRATAAGAWDPPTVVDDFLQTIGGAQEDPWISDDGKTFVFAVSINNNKDVYITTR